DERETAVSKINKMLMSECISTDIIKGKKSFEMSEVVQYEPNLKARVQAYGEEKPKADKEFSALVNSVKDLAMQIIETSPNIPTEAGIAIRNIENSSFLIHFISSNTNADVAEKQKLLEIVDLKKRAELVCQHLSQELQMLELKNQIQSKGRTDIDKQQREYFLNQQLRTIQEELGGSTPDAEIQDLRQRGEKKKWSKEVHEAFNKEIDKLLRMNPAAAEYSVVLNYAELLLELPW